MRKLTNILLVLCILLLVGCNDGKDIQSDKESQNPSVTEDEPGSNLDKEKSTQTVKEIILNEANIVEDAVEYVFVNMYSGSEVIPPKPGSMITKYIASPGNTFIVAVMDVKNLTTSDIAAEKLLETSLTINDKIYEGSSVVEKDGGSNLVRGRSANISALDQARVHYMFEVPAEISKDNLKLEISSGTDTREIFTNLTEFKPKIKNVKLNTEITDDETISLEINDIYFSNTLYPPITSGYYSYYEAESNKTFLIVKMTVKNLKGTDMSYDSIAGVKCTYNEKYNYSSFTVFETDGGSNLKGYARRYSISPLDKGIVYYLMEVPAEAENGKIEVDFYIADDYYNYIIE